MDWLIVRHEGGLEGGWSKASGQGHRELRLDCVDGIAASQHPASSSVTKP